jgi:hypothetical protein
MENTEVISFRAHKNIKSWLDFAGRGFTGRKPELLRLIIMQAVMQQPHNSGFGSFLGRISGDSRQQPSIGGTAVYAVRVPKDIINSAREIAAGKNMGISEWCAKCLYAWLESFKPIYERNKENAEDWLDTWAISYRAKVEELAAVYVQNYQKEVDENAI